MKNGRYKKDGDVRWYLDDQLHREDGPAVEWTDGLKEWFFNGIRHRENGPAIEYQDESATALNGKSYFQWIFEGLFHRENGPAIIGSDGTKEWYFKGKRHREDGPAVEFPDGRKMYYLNGTKVTDEEFNHWLEKKNLNEKLRSIFSPKQKIKRGKI